MKKAKTKTKSNEKGNKNDELHIIKEENFLKINNVYLNRKTKRNEKKKIESSSEENNKYEKDISLNENLTKSEKKRKQIFNKKKSINTKRKRYQKIKREKFLNFEKEKKFFNYEEETEKYKRKKFKNLTKNKSFNSENKENINKEKFLNFNTNNVLKSKNEEIKSDSQKSSESRKIIITQKRIKFHRTKRKVSSQSEKGKSSNDEEKFLPIDEKKKKEITLNKQNLRNSKKNDKLSNTNISNNPEGKHNINKRKKSFTFKNRNDSSEKENNSNTDNEIKSKLFINKSYKEEDEKFIEIRENKEKNINNNINENDNEKIKEFADVFQKCKSQIDIKFEELEEKIKEKFEEKSKKIKEKLEEKSKKDKEELESKLFELKKNIGILTEINIESEKYINNNLIKTINNMNFKLNNILNAFKVLYIRKIANLILDGLVSKYKDSLGVTSKKFYNQRLKFNLIIAVKEIEKIDIYQINLIFDFLMHIKEKCSSIIHLNEKNIVQKEIFNLYIKDMRGEKEDEIIKINEMVGVLFEKPEYIEQNEDSEKDGNKIEQIKNIIKKEKEKIIKKDNKIKNDKEKKKIILNDDIINNNKKEKEKKIVKENINISKSYKSDISDSDSEYDIKKLRRILDGKEDINSNIIILLESLQKKITLNQQKVNEEFTDYKVKEINQNYFYASWKSSFNKEYYKKTKGYKHFIKKDKILSLEDMGKNVLKLLKDYQINIYVEDPGYFDKNITNIIDNYNIKDGKVISVKYQNE